MEIKIGDPVVLKGSKTCKSIDDRTRYVRDIHVWLEGSFEGAELEPTKYAELSWSRGTGGVEHPDFAGFYKLTTLELEDSEHSATRS